MKWVGITVEGRDRVSAHDYTDKPAVVAVRTLTTLAAGRRFTGSVLLEPSSLHAMVLDGPADRAVALWSDAPCPSPKLDPWSNDVVAVQVARRSHSTALV